MADGTETVDAKVETLARSQNAGTANLSEPLPGTLTNDLTTLPTWWGATIVVGIEQYEVDWCEDQQDWGVDEGKYTWDYLAVTLKQFTGLYICIGGTLHKKKIKRL